MEVNIVKIIYQALNVQRVLLVCEGSNVWILFATYISCFNR